MTSTPITESDVAQRVREERLSVREKIGYGLGDAGGTVITCLIMNFLTFFYTDIFGLTPALVGTLLAGLMVNTGLSPAVALPAGLFIGLSGGTLGGGFA